MSVDVDEWRADPAQIWPVLRQLSREGRGEQILEIDHSDLADELDDLAPLGPAETPSPSARLGALVDVAYFASNNNVTAESVTRLLHATRSLSQRKSPTPVEVELIDERPQEMIDRLLVANSAHPGVLVASDLVSSVRDMSPSLAKTTTEFLTSHHIGGDVLALELEAVSGPPGMRPDRAAMPFFICDQDFEDALTLAWRLAGDPLASVRWTIRNTRTGLTPPLVIGASVGLAGAVGTASLVDQQDVVRGVAFTGEIDPSRAVRSLAPKTGDLSAYAAKLASADGRRVIVPSTDLVELDRLAPTAELEGVATVDRAMDLATAERSGAARATANPYRGLAGYSRSDARWFAGREFLVAAALAQLLERDFLALVGPSGTGKSSLIRAGLQPAVSAVPSVLGDSFAIEELAPDPATIEAATSDLGGSPRLLFVDQLERLFAHDRVEVERAIAALSAAVDSPMTKVVVALRIDRYQDLITHIDFAKRVQQAQLLVGPMTRAELRRAIERPAKLAGARLEDGLVDQILDDASGQPGALPLMSIALEQTWAESQGELLTMSAYRASGGVGGALTKLAEDVYAAADHDGQRAIKSVMLRLVEAPSSRNEVRRERRTAPLAELRGSESNRGATEALAERRLIAIDQGSAEISHDALLKEWPRLRTWVDQDRELGLVRQRIAERAADWAAVDSDGDADDLLFSEAQMEEAAPIEASESLSAGEIEFLAASRNEISRRRKRRRVILTAVSLGLALLAFSILIAVQNSRLADEQTLRAEESSAWATFNEEDVAVRRLAARSTDTLSVDYPAALLLAVEAVEADRRRELAPDGSAPQTAVLARSTLVNALQYTNRIEGFLHDDRRSRRAITITADGSHAIAGSDNGTVAIWNLDTRQLVVEPIDMHHGVEVRGIASHPVDPIAASGGEDGTVVLWDLATGTPLGEPLVHNAVPDEPALFDSSAVPAVAFSNDGTLLASGDRSGKIIIWDIEDRVPIAELQDRGLILGLDFSPDDSRLGSATTLDGNLGTFTLWDLMTGDQVLAPVGYHQGTSNQVQFHPTLPYLLTCSQDRTVVVFDLGLLEENPDDLSSGRQWPAHDNGALDCRWTDGGESIVSVGPDIAVTHLGPDPVQFFADVAITPAEPQVRFEASGGILAEIGIAADDRTAVVAGVGGDVVLLDLSQGVALGRRILTANETQWTVGSSGPGLALTSDGATVAAGKENGEVYLWDVASGELMASWAAHENGIWHAEFVGENELLMTGSEDTTVGVWDPTATDPLVLRFEAHRETPGAVEFTAIYDIAISPDGRLVASCDTAGGLIVWQLADGTVDWRTKGDGFECRVTWSADGTSVYWTHSTSIERLSAIDGTVEAPSIDGGHTEPIFSSVLAGDGTLYTGGRDSNLAQTDVLEWVLTDGSLARLPQTPNDLVLIDDFAELGEVLVASIRNGDTLVIDPTNGDLLLDLEAHGDGVWRSAYSAVSKTLVTGDFDGVVVSRSLDLDDWMRRACAIAGRSLTEAEWSELMGEVLYPDTCASIAR